MSSGKHDLSALELEYISGGDDLSIRELARRHDASFSSFASIARRESWEQKRKDYRSKQITKAVDELTTSVAVKVAKIKTEALDVIEMAIIKMGLDLQDRVLGDGTVVPGMQVTPSDMAKLLDRLMPLIGQPNNINENRNLGIDLTNDLPPDVARLLADVAGERGTDTGTVGRASLPGARAARTN
jgi:hypothetical protein